MKNYKTNSNASREKENASEDKKLEAVVNGETHLKKKKTINKILSLLINDNVEDIPYTILHDIVVPVVKESAYKMINDASYILLSDSTHRIGRNLSRTMYGSFYESDSERLRPRTRTSDKKAGYTNAPRRYNNSCDNVIFTTRVDAEMVLESMFNVLNSYDSVSVADFHELANIPNDNYTLNNYGWTDLTNAKIVQTRDGYMIKMPKPIQLRRV